MKKLPTLLLAIALMALLAGLVELTQPGGWGLGVPLAAVFFGLFGLTKVLQKESARFDEEHHPHPPAGETADAKERLSKPWNR